MKKIILPLTCCLVAMTTYAQHNFVPGTVAISQQDSLRGFVDFKNWSSSPKEIFFKTTENGAVTKYTPEQISGFTMQSNGELMYVTKHVLLDITPYIVSSTQRVTQPQTELLDSTVFIQQLVVGDYNLYTYTDSHQRVHFMYGAPGQEIQELKYIKTLVPAPEGSKLYEKREYQDQLATLFRDDSKVAKQAKGVEYRDDKLIALFVAYHQTQHPGSTIAVKSNKRNPVYWGIVAGPSFNSFKMKGGESYPLHGDYSSSVGPVAGIFMDIPFGGATRKFSVYNELLFKSYSTDAKMDMSRLLDGDVATFKLSYVQLNIMVQYIYTRSFIKPFVHIGMGNAVVVSTKKNDYYDASRDEHYEAMSDLRKLEQSLIGGVGVKVSRFQLEVRGSTTTGFVPKNSTSMPVNSLQVIAGFRLK
ncbi:outer membrane beta-barrel protein [Chitinophaga sp.]|uniref:outer membrane beta-barrel protein n=1 Tax=Chitinophaga sp. TaxID=1869181 RepID=UPI0031E2A109